MQSHQQQPTKKLKLSNDENTNPSNTIETKSMPSLFFTVEKEKEMLFFSKLRNLKKNLQRQDYKRLLSARLASIDYNKFRTTTRPAAKYLRSIIHTLCVIVLEDRDAIREYLTESMNHNTTQNNRHVIQLANILIELKKAITDTGLLSNRAGVFENARYTDMLKQNYNWVAYFHCVIKWAFDKMGATPQTFRELTMLTSTLQTLQGLTYDSLQQNFPEISDQYIELKYKKIEASSHLFFVEQLRSAQQKQNSDNTNTASLSSPSQASS